MTCIDVAIPSYQYARFLRDAAGSVLAQDTPDLRLLIIDNASTDGSPEIARDIARSDSRVELVLNDRNRGAIDSCNRALDWASAEYSIILDADDMLAAGSMAAGMKILDSHPDVAFLYGTEARLHGDVLYSGRCNPRAVRYDVKSGSQYIRETCRNSFCDVGAPAVMMRTAALRGAGCFRKRLSRTYDFEMYLRLAMQGDVARTSRVLGVRRIHDAQLSKPFDDDRVLDFEEHEKAFDSFFEYEGSALADAADLRALARRRSGDYAYCYGVVQRMRGRENWRAAMEYAATRRPAPAWVPPVPYLFRRRWVDSVARRARAVLYEDPSLGPSYEVPSLR